MVFDFMSTKMGGQEFRVAEPEKALLDHWHLTKGEWTLERLEEMRYQHLDQIDRDRLRDYAGRFHRLRLDRAVQRWLDLAASVEQDAGLLTRTNLEVLLS